jgi:uncharacterized protein (TIGR02271 family)
MTVVGSDGDKLGTVDHVENDVIVVQKGFFFPKNHYIPLNAVAQTDEDSVYLTVTKETALTQGWDEPVDDTWREPDVATTNTSAEYTMASSGTSVDGGLEVDEQPFEHEQDSQRTHVNEDDDILIPVHEEELTATRRPVERGAVRVERDVIEERQALDVPVTEEEVHVTRRAVDRDAAPSDTAFDEGTIEVPVYGEEVDVQKRARVREEVEISKDAVTETERVSDTVRREEVVVEDDTDADARTR